VRQLIVTDMWDKQYDSGIRCVTTNGVCSKNGKAIMGRGCALEAKLHYPGIDTNLAVHLHKNGNVVGKIWLAPTILSFPTKENWWDKSTDHRILQSCQQLLDLLKNDSIKQDIYLPRPGCGAGEMKWEYVKKILAAALPDQVIVVSREGDE